MGPPRPPLMVPPAAALPPLPALHATRLGPLRPSAAVPSFHPLPLRTRSTPTGCVSPRLTLLARPCSQELASLFPCWPAPPTSAPPACPRRSPAARERWGEAPAHTTPTRWGRGRPRRAPARATRATRGCTLETPGALGAALYVLRAAASPRLCGIALALSRPLAHAAPPMGTRHAFASLARRWHERRPTDKRNCRLQPLSPAPAATKPCKRAHARNVRLSPRARPGLTLHAQARPRRTAPSPCC
ncbi:MAG: hypothetical protein J3K34DRAFT_428986 [Monoraphidium minutum]|nr:MAG: hypothetical protein J3K34DRAFT_428986 [Monoraphidium minutum]